MIAASRRNGSGEPARRVLIVDDDRDFANALRNLLTLEGYGVETASNQAEALAAIERFDAEVAILDYRLGPTMGLDLVSPLKERRPGLDCILSTAHADMDSVVGALRHRVYDYLMKPLQADQLLAALDRCFEKRRLEADMRAADAALRESKKTEAVGQVVGGVAHHFNNLLTIIQGNLELLRERLPGDAGQLGLLENAFRAVERAAEINRGLVTYTRSQVLRPEPVDLAELVSQVVRELRDELGESIEIEAVTPGGLWEVCVDRERFKLAIACLAHNARDAMPDGGKLMIETANIVGPGIDDMPEGGAPPHRFVALAVTDTGRGIASDIAERVFEPFFTDKSMADKAGLGLSIVHGLVKQSGGQVDLESEVGSGTTVTLYLPAIPEDSATPAPESRRTAVPKVHKLKIARRGAAPHGVWARRRHTGGGRRPMSPSARPAETSARLARRRPGWQDAPRRKRADVKEGPRI